MTDALGFRSPGLVVGILGYVYDADGPVPWPEVIETFSADARPWKTVENVLYELVAFGAIHRIGKPGDRRRPDTRALVATTLGRAWLDREILPLPTDRDPLAEADEIAARLKAGTEISGFRPVIALAPGPAPNRHLPGEPAGLPSGDRITTAPANPTRPRRRRSGVE